VGRGKVKSRRRIALKRANQPRISSASFRAKSERIASVSSPPAKVCPSPMRTRALSGNSSSSRSQTSVTWWKNVHSFFSAASAVMVTTATSSTCSMLQLMESPFAVHVRGLGFSPLMDLRWEQPGT
jgi:hypothetical protein